MDFLSLHAWAGTGTLSGKLDGRNRVLIFNIADGSTSAAL
ncbi:hypothetical protein ACCUM_0145 [Candidatus Accumulibacter phosphatis]|uniref:Uncharacterized protein n=1 Tax=Candidatus Accumulibacter phosphatis TaxID=327160 RepID=A0A5S4EL41_9PROT|nr:hypothetical protein ACCUM_0145 [Candidatus Accumulibacter phosphatis]